MSSPSSNMNDGIKRLEAVWAETSQDWRDDVATRFRSEFWEPLAETARRYRKVLEALEAALDEAEIDD